jgi:hypothetical protein
VAHSGWRCRRMIFDSRLTVSSFTRLLQVDSNTWGCGTGSPLMAPIEPRLDIPTAGASKQRRETPEWNEWRALATCDAIAGVHRAPRTAAS